jgi:nucleoside 2-deoxyribosyltransferase
MPSARTPSKKSCTVFFSGPLFDLKHLVGNAYLAEAVYEKSHGRYLCRLAQDLTPGRHGTHGARDETILALFASDLAIFTFDGSDLDSGTVVEFMLAKMADIPAVILRTDQRDTRPARGSARDPWSIMASHYPRTLSLQTDVLRDYRKLQKTRLRRVHDDVVRLAGQHASATASIICDRLAVQLVQALDRVSRQPPRMPRHLREEVYQWLALMPGLRGKEKLLRKTLETHLTRKVKKDLL